MPEDPTNGWMTWKNAMTRALAGRRFLGLFPAPDFITMLEGRAWFVIGDGYATCCADGHCYRWTREYGYEVEDGRNNISDDKAKLFIQQHLYHFWAGEKPEDQS